MTFEQLKQAEKRLEAEQLVWSSKRKELERLMRTANITLDDLMPKVEAAKTELTSLRTQLTELGEQKQAMLNDAAQVEANTAKLQRENGEARRQLQELQALVDAKRAEVDSDVSDYAKAKRAEANMTLADLRAEVATTTNSLDMMTVQVKNKRDEFNSINQAILQAGIEHERLKQQFEQELADLKAQLPDIKAELADVRKQLNQAKFEHELVVSDKNKAKIEHENFLRYEANARKMLATKDQELQERSAELEQGSRHLKAARSFLPPL